MTAPIPLGRYDWATGQWMTPEEERAKVRNAALGDGFGPAFSPGEMAAARAPLPITPPPTGLTGVDGYGQPVEQPVWQGYTLDDLLDRATTGSVTSSVPEGRTGYGLDEVGNANISHNTSKKIDWQGLLGGALAGAGSVRAGDGWGSIGTGFLGGTDYQYGRETQARRNALTDSQIQYQAGRNDLNQLEISDYPVERSRKADEFAARQAWDASRLEENRVQIANLLAGAQRDAEMFPLEMDTERARAENYREIASGRGRTPANREDWIANRAAILMGRAQYDDYGDRTEGISAAEAMALATQLWDEAHQAGKEAPPPRRPGKPYSALEAPFETLGGGGGQGPVMSQDPNPGETAQQYADRMGPVLGGAEARRRWQQAHP